MRSFWHILAAVMVMATLGLVLTASILAIGAVFANAWGDAVGIGAALGAVVVYVAAICSIIDWKGY